MGVSSTPVGIGYWITYQFFEAVTPGLVDSPELRDDCRSKGLKNKY